MILTPRIPQTKFTGLGGQDPNNIPYDKNAPLKDQVCCRDWELKLPQNRFSVHIQNTKHCSYPNMPFRMMLMHCCLPCEGNTCNRADLTQHYIFHRALQVLQSFQRSLQNLQTAYVDSLVLHSPMPTHAQVCVCVCVFVCMCVIACICVPLLFLLWRLLVWLFHSNSPLSQQVSYI